ncbi:hypothetical protein Tco_0725679 [Tanacetum coccineum]|uniref:Zinc finger, CCHC-type n=1 Tax=Tanacetum coccineum TaxID=301880 RepID=A0ABQ4YFR0_9ASTR
MVVAAMKYMASNFAKLDKFKGVDLRRWQKKMHFLVSNMSVVYVLTTPIPEDGENATMEQIRKRNKWDNDDYVCREIWDSLEAKYMVEDASSKKFLVSNFTNYKKTDSRPVMEQYNELLGILGRFTQYKINMDEAIQVSCIIDKLLPSWKDFKHTLKHQKEELTLVELGSHLRIEESLMVQDNDKPKGNNVVGLSVVNMDDDVAWLNIVNDNIASALMSTSKLNDSIVWHARLGHHAKAFRFYVIKPNESVSINSIIESRDAIYDENKFSSVPRPSQRSLINGTEDIGASMVPEKVTEEVLVQQPEPELRKRTRDEDSDRHSYCFNVEDDPKTFDEAMKSQDVSFWKEAINDEMDSILGNNT